MAVNICQVIDCLEVVFVYSVLQITPQVKTRGGEGGGELGECGAHSNPTGKIRGGGGSG